MTSWVDAVDGRGNGIFLASVEMRISGARVSVSEVSVLLDTLPDCFWTSS